MERLVAVLVVVFLVVPSADAQFVPDDEYYDSGGLYGGQWNLRRIHMPEAWETSTGDGAVVVAIIDSHPNILHLDLRDALWTNDDPPGDADGDGDIDDDGNGIGDDTNGVYFGIGSNDKRGVSLVQPNPGGVVPEMHGTATASITLGRTNNLPNSSGTARGIAGIAGGGPNGPGVQWMPIGIVTSGSQITTLATAIDYAVAEGADVINMSVAFCSPNALVEQAVQDAYAAGVVLVASSGNQSGANGVTFGSTCPGAFRKPASYPEVIAVGAVTHDGRRWNRSEPNTDNLAGDFLTAPGGAFIPAADPYSTATPEYTFDFGGTSAAAPHVAGVAALVRSIAPSLTPAEVGAILTASADPAGCAENNDPDADAGDVLTYAQECGAGLLDARAALAMALDIVFTTAGGRFAADLVVPAGETVTTGAVTLAFAPGARLVVEGTLVANGTTFQTSSTSETWGGLLVTDTGDATLTGATVDMRASASPGGTKHSWGNPPAVAVTSGGHLVLDGSEVVGLSGFFGDGTNGVVVTGTGSRAEIRNGSEVRNNAGAGVLAQSGGAVFIDGSETLVWQNGSGVVADGAGSIVTFGGGTVESNLGPGTRATGGGRVDVWQGYTPPAGGGNPTSFAASTPEPVRILGNQGGLYADAGSYTDTGYTLNCVQPPCYGPPVTGQNRIEQNVPPGSGLYDALATGGSQVYAPENWWGTPDLAQIETFEDGSSWVKIKPILTAPPSGASLTSLTAGGADPSADDPTFEPTDPDGVQALVAQAERLRVGNAPVQAGLRLLYAYDVAETGAERRAVGTAAERLLARARAPQLEAWAEATSALSGADRTRARRVLATALVAQGRRARAAQVARALVADGHEAFGYRLLVRLAVENGREADALAALAALAQVDAEAAALSAVSVALAFPDADVASVFEPDARSVEPDALSLAEGQAATGAEFEITVAPNPATHYVTVRIASEEAGGNTEAVRVIVFDALGREVLSRTVETDRVRLVVSALSPGVYVARATSGERRSAARFVVAR